MHTDTLSLKRDLISAGITAWISAIPIPASTALRISSTAESRNRRDTVAMPIISNESTTVRCSPSRWLTRRPKNIASPIAITGSMVSSEARLKLSAMSPRMADNKGPTAAMEGRRFRATRMMPAISQRAGREVARTFSINRTLYDKEPIRRWRGGGRKSKCPGWYLEIKYYCRNTAPCRSELARDGLKSAAFSQ
ncbi:hypothetical protein D3C86_1513320 [compost metagenome]